MLLEIPMYSAYINTGTLQRFIDLSILRKTRCRNQCLVRFSVLTLPLTSVATLDLQQFCQSGGPCTNEAERLTARGPSRFQ
jgi:hypothetical protein